MNSCNQGKSSSGLPEGSTDRTSTINVAWVPQRNFLPSIPPSTETKNNRNALLGNDKQTTNQLKKRSSVTNNNKKKKKKKKKEEEDDASSATFTGKREKRNLDLVVGEGVSFDFSGVPTPICSCTGVSRQCYKWGAGGWQSSCCTTTISEYPLPMSTSRPGSRLAGRKMSNGAYGKLLHRLAMEGCDLKDAIDLKNHWARHGTNKFVTIR